MSKTKYGIFVSAVKSTLESAVENDAIILPRTVERSFVRC